MFENMSPEAMAAWHALTGTWGQPLSINSAYRSPEHNARVGGAKRSQHTHGNAFDVDVSGLSKAQRNELAKQAYDAGFRGFGVYDTAMHFDVGPERAWGPSHSRDSLPSWFTMPGGAPGSVEAPLTFGNLGPAPSESEGTPFSFGNYMPVQKTPLETLAEMASSLTPTAPPVQPISPMPVQPYQPVRRDTSEPYMALFESLMR